MRSGSTQLMTTSTPWVKAYMESSDVCFNNSQTITDITEDGRIISISCHEKLYGGTYFIELDNSDEALSGVDYRGTYVDIWWGFVEEYAQASALPSLVVDKQSLVSRDGKLIMVLECLDYWARLSFYNATLGGGLWNHPTQSPDYLATHPNLPDETTIPDSLITAISAQYGVTIQEIVESVITSTLSWATITLEAGYSDTNYYNYQPMVQGTDSRSIIKQAMDGCSSYLILYGTTGFKLINPSNASVCYIFTHGTYFSSSVITTSLVRPNNIVYYGIDADGNMLITGAGHGKDTDSINTPGIGNVYEHNFNNIYDITKLTTQVEVDDAADLRLANLKSGLAEGTIIAPMHCSLELMDKISIDDDRYGTHKTHTGFVYEILREYKAGVYQITIKLGGVTSGNTPSGGLDMRAYNTTSGLPIMGSGGESGGMTQLSDDSQPVLGNNLDVDEFSIVGGSIPILTQDLGGQLTLGGAGEVKEYSASGYGVAISAGLETPTVPSSTSGAGNLSLIGAGQTDIQSGLQTYIRSGSGYGISIKAGATPITATGDDVIISPKTSDDVVDIYYLRLQSAMNANLKKLNFVADPTSAQDASTKNYVDTRLPSGVICMWHGTLANIPSGWVLCNGSNSTPDLRGRFVQGALNGYNPGDTGGASSKTTSGHTHTTGDFTLTSSHIPSHTHSSQKGQASSVVFQSGSSYSSWSGNIADTTGSYGSGGSHNHGSTGSNTDSISDIRPMFYTIAFIMKT